MAVKFPPPPFMIGQLQQLNRWLLDIQSILNAGGFIDPLQVSGLVDAYAQLALDTANIATLTLEVAQNTTDITTLQGQVATNSNDISTLQGQVATLQTNVTALLARNQILNGTGVPAAGLGNNGDLYIDNAAFAGSRLYGKIAGAWVIVP